MSKKFNGNPLSTPGQSLPAAGVDSVRQLIANGKSKTALEKAKELHKQCGSPDSEALLIDAYIARGQSLLEQGLAMEAKSLLDLVRERHPSFRERIEQLGASAALRASSLEDLLKPLNDPDLPPDRRAAIEQEIQNHVWNLEALAACDVLPPTHPLREASRALHRAFEAVTAGPVSEQALTLAEVSHRSPLAPWKLLIRAIACFYRKEDAACGDLLRAIKPESVAARLVPAMLSMLDGNGRGCLGLAATALTAAAVNDGSALRRALESLETALEVGTDSQILKAVSAAVQQCQDDRPASLDVLRRHISVRCTLSEINRKSIESALGGRFPADAEHARLLARGLEQSDDPEDLATACAMWEEFRQRAVRESWFRPNSLEASVLYLHMARIPGKLPPRLLSELQQQSGGAGKQAAAEDFYFLNPEKLYERACAIDPHTDAFSQWFEWAKRGRKSCTERVAASWHQACPSDIEPVLFLVEQYSARGAFPTALQYLTAAERIDGVHPSVRQLRLRLLVGNAIQDIQKKKPHLALKRLDALAALPQSHQGARPAVLAAIRSLAETSRGNEARAAEARADTERVLGSRTATELLLFGLAAAAKKSGLAKLRTVRSLSDSERKSIPAALADIVALVADAAGTGVRLHEEYINDAAVQLLRDREELTADQLRILGEAGQSIDHAELTFLASKAGLRRGATTEATFLLLRARCLPAYQHERRAVCAAAAVELARHHKDSQLLEKAVGILQQLEPAGFSIALEQARQVVQKEAADPAYPTGANYGPDYSAFREQEECSCPECRRRRGEDIDPFDDAYEDEDESDGDFDELPIPPDMPPAIAKILMAETAKAVQNGESLESLIDRLFGEGTARSHGRRKRK